MNVIIPLPEKLSFYQWASRISQNFISENIPLPDDETEWREWGENLRNLPAFADIPLPLKTLYPREEDWKLWAEEVIFVFDN